MIEPKTITEQLLFSTVKIDSEIKNGKSIETGFIFDVRYKDKTISIIFTKNNR